MVIYWWWVIHSILINSILQFIFLWLRSLWLSCTIFQYCQTQIRETRWWGEWGGAQKTGNRNKREYPASYSECSLFTSQPIEVRGKGLLSGWEKSFLSLTYNKKLDSWSESDPIWCWSQTSQTTSRELLRWENNRTAERGGISIYNNKNNTRQKIKGSQANNKFLMTLIMTAFNFVAYLQHCINKTFHAK